MEDFEKGRKDKTTPKVYECCICKSKLCLSYFFPMHPFSTPWKYQKTFPVFWCFQGVQKVRIWEQLSQCSVMNLGRWKYNKERKLYASIDFTGTACQRATKLMIAIQLLSVECETNNNTTSYIRIKPHQQIIRHLQKPL